MNQTIELLKEHVSVRSFTNRKLTQEQVEELVVSAQSASTASFLQAYTIIGIEEEEEKKKISKLAGDHAFITEGSHFFIFCADLQRHFALSKELKIDIQPTLDGIDAILVGSIDATLAAQNMTIAAESMGLGVCYIGGVRDNIEKISEILNLPEYVFPIYGLVIGYPNEKNNHKPRLPMNSIYHINEYKRDMKTDLDDYEKETTLYYSDRSNDKKDRSWGENTLRALARHPRLSMKKFLNSKGWAKR